MSLTAPQPGYAAAVYLTGTSTVDAAEACSHVSGSGATQLFQVTNAAKHVWDPTVPVVVTDSVTGVVSPADYAFNPLFGTIQFAGFTPSGTISIAGNYLPIKQFAGANKFDLNLKQTLVDTTAFGDSDASVRRTGTLVDSDGTVDLFDDGFVILDGGTETILTVLYGQVPCVIGILLGGGIFRAFALFEGVKTSAAVADVIRSTLSWKQASLNPALAMSGIGK